MNEIFSGTYKFKNSPLTLFQVWGLTLVKEDKYLITGCGDSELRVWSIVPKESSVKDSENVEKTVPDTEAFVTGDESSNVEGIVSN
jgi:U3 small nucleolar RNA-associated protein 12